MLYHSHNSILTDTIAPVVGNDSEVMDARMNEFDESRVAVIIPVYNGEDTIERALISVLEQDLPDGIDLDIIVVDDCSTDRTAELVRGLAVDHPNLTLLTMEENTGPAGARNKGLSATRAAWYTPLDADDYMSAGRLRGLLLTALRGEWDIVADNLLITDQTDKVLRVLWPAKPQGNVRMSLAFFVKRNLSHEGKRSELGYLKPLIHRSVFAPAHTRYLQTLWYCEDYDLYTRLLASGAKACLIDSLGYHAVQHADSLSRRQKATDMGRVAEVDKALLARDGLDQSARSAIKRHLAQTQREWVWLRAIDAVKARNMGALASCFQVSPNASLSLLWRLVKQFALRVKDRAMGTSELDQSP